MLLDDKSAIMTQREFDELLNYSCSLPTGVILGKQWKRRYPYTGEPHAWYLGTYEEHPTDESMARIVFREIIDIVPDVREDDHAPEPA